MATLAIYALGVLLCLLAGTALAGLLDPRGTWVGITTIPLGFSVLVALLYPVGWFAGSTIATPIVIAILVVALAVAVVLRLRLADEGVRIGAALGPARPGSWCSAPASSPGALLLAATIEQELRDHDRRHQQRRMGLRGPRSRPAPRTTRCPPTSPRASPIP